MTNGTETVQATTTDGMSVNITLAEWASNLVNHALAKHKLDCPVEKYRGEWINQLVELDRRVLALELKLKIVHWLIIPFYVGFAGWFISQFTNLFNP